MSTAVNGTDRTRVPMFQTMKHWMLRCALPEPVVKRIAGGLCSFSVCVCGITTLRETSSRRCLCFCYHVDLEQCRQTRKTIRQAKRASRPALSKIDTNSFAGLKLSRDVQSFSQIKLTNIDYFMARVFPNVSDVRNVNVATLLNMFCIFKIIGKS